MKFEEYKDNYYIVVFFHHFSNYQVVLQLAVFLLKRYCFANLKTFIV